MKKIILSSDVFIIEDFLSSSECITFINSSEQKGYEEATVTTLEGQKMIKGIRNNTRVIENNTELANKFWNKISPFIEDIDKEVKPIGVNEQFRFYKYVSGQRFNKHRDGKFTRNESEESRLTLMVYLNEEFTGGETEFDDFSVTPKSGTALIFKHEVKHKGCMVESGSKYAIRTDIMFSK
jgi:predicted 2-oxoglutarate/Fe(II)-dependent dioxygenase YbiX